MFVLSLVIIWIITSLANTNSLSSTEMNDCVYRWRSDFLVFKTATNLSVSQRLILLINNINNLALLTSVSFHLSTAERWIDHIRAMWRGSGAQFHCSVSELWWKTVHRERERLQLVGCECLHRSRWSPAAESVSPSASRRLLHLFRITLRELWGVHSVRHWKLLYCYLGNLAGHERLLLVGNYRVPLNNGCVLLIEKSIIAAWINWSEQSDDCILHWNTLRHCGCFTTI